MVIGCAHPPRSASVSIATNRTSFAVSTRAARWARLIPAAIVAAVVLGGCGKSDKVTGPAAAASIVISAPSGQTVVEGTLQFTAVVKDADGNTLALTPTWSVAHGGGAINSSGLFTAGDSAAAFTNTVVATSGVATSASTVTVLAGPLATITVTPGTINLLAGATQQFTAAGKDAHGNAVAILNRVWSIAAAGGTIDTSGMFTAGTTAGVFTNTVTATSDSVSGEGSVTIGGGPVASIEITLDTAAVAIGGTQQYIVTGRDANNNVVPVVPAPVWSIVAGGGTIDASTGLFTAGTVSGDFVNTIHVVSGTVSASTSVKVAAGALATIVVEPLTVSLAAGATQQFTAVGKDAHDNVVPTTPVWSVAASGGTINSSGLFTAGSTAGVFTNTVEATDGSIVGKATVTVTGGALASITVSPVTGTMAIGGQQQFTAVGHDAQNNVVAFTPTWSVAAGGGTIDASTGLFTAGTVAGSFSNTVTATSGSISGTASVVVEAGPLANLTISPTSATLAVGATQQFTVVGTDAGGNVIPISATWSVFAGGGTINSSGLFTAGTTAGTFTNTVVVTSGTLAAVATIKVTPGPVVSIAITPANPTITVGSNQKFTAVGTDAFGNTVTLSSGWVNGNAVAGTLSASGNFHASTVGVWPNQIEFVSGTITGTTSVTITP
jgi:hypothetical protein